MHHFAHFGGFGHDGGAFIVIVLVLLFVAVRS